MLPSFYRNRTAVSLSTALLCIHCSPSAHSQQPVSVTPDELRVAYVEKKDEPSSAERRGSGERFVADVPEGSLGPHLHLGKKKQVVVWVTPFGEEPGVYSVLLPKFGAASAPQRVFPLDTSVRQLQVGPTHREKIGVVMIRRDGVHERDVLEFLQLGPEGELLGKLQKITETPRDILWAQVVPSASGGVLIWAERDGQGAEIFRVGVSASGAFAPHSLVHNVKSWQIAHGALGASLVVFEGGADGRIVLRQLGAAGQVLGAPIVLAADVDGALDLDMVITKSHIVVAWSEIEEGEGRLHRVVLDASGNIVHHDGGLTERRRDQVLVGLFGDDDSDIAHVVWEAPLENAGGGRSLLAATIDPENARAGRVQSLALAGKDPLLPRFAQRKNALQFLAEIPQGKFASRRVAGTLINASSATKNLKLKESSSPMAWDLQCSPQDCYYLLADDSSPQTHVYISRVLPDKSPAKVWSSLQAETFPRLGATRVIAEVPEISSLVGAPLGGESDLLFWLSYFDPSQPYITPSQPAPDGRRAPLRALLKTMTVGRNIEARDGLLEGSQVVSYRARSLGGAVVVKPQKGKGLLLWAALDGKSPQLFATQIDARGNKISQKMLTRQKGEITDVAAARVDNGYIIGWIESKGDRAKIFTQKIDLNLRKTSKPLAIGEHLGAPSGLQLARQGKDVVGVFAASQAPGSAAPSEIYSFSLHGVSARKKEGLQKITATPFHSHSPQIASTEEGSSSFVCSWIESGTNSQQLPLLSAEHEPSRAAQEPNSTAQLNQSAALQFASLSSSGKLLGRASSAQITGTVVAFSLDCTKANCRALATAEISGERNVQGSIWAATYRKGEAIQSQKIMPLRVGVTTGVTPLLVGDDAFFVDADEDRTRWLLRRATIEWFKPR